MCSCFECRATGSLGIEEKRGRPALAGLVDGSEDGPVRVDVLLLVGAGDRLLARTRAVLDVVRVQSDLVRQILQLDHRAARHHPAGPTYPPPNKKM